MNELEKSQYRRSRKKVEPILKLRLVGTVLSVLVIRSDNQSVEIGDSVDLEPLIAEAVKRATEDKP